jgi:hypothetical protein
LIRPKALTSVTRATVWSPEKEKSSFGNPPMHDRDRFKLLFGRPFTAAEDALLGTATDREIAVRLNRDLQTIYGRRKRLGIPPFVKRKPQKRVVWTAAMDSKLGTMPDTVLARKLGCSSIAVFYRRRRLKVQSFGE